MISIDLVGKIYQRYHHTAGDATDQELREYIYY